MPSRPLTAAVCASMRKLLALVVLAPAVAGCGSGGRPAAPTMEQARVFRLVGFAPAQPVEAGKPFRMSFAIRQPSGKVLTAYRTGSGPHTGVHVIVVPRDLSSIVHRHPPLQADGTANDTITLPAPGKYRVVVDAYPQTPGGAASSVLPGRQSNFQLFTTIDVKGTAKPKTPPPFEPTVVVDGYRFHVARTPRLKAVEAATIQLEVTDRNGRPAAFAPYYGALAHAIFFRERTLDYFHTHVCSAGAAGCASVLGASQITGSSTEPGRLDVGVLLPVAGTWRLFLQTKAGGRVLTAPFTLEVT